MNDIERAIVDAAFRVVGIGVFRFREDDDGHEYCGFCEARYYSKTGGCRHEKTCAAMNLLGAVKKEADRRNSKPKRKESPRG